MNKEELYTITGGATSISGTMINSLCKLLTLLVDLGRQVGSGIRYAKSGNKCS